MQTVFDVQRRTQVSIQDVKVFAKTDTDVSKDMVSGVCGHEFEAWHALHVSWTQ